MSPTSKRFLVVSLLLAVISIVAYLEYGRSAAGSASGRSPFGLLLGLLGTLAMIGAAAYSWRRRMIARASRPIEVDRDARKDLIAREKRALEQLQSLQRASMRSPQIDLAKLRKESRQILRANRVRRTICARVVGGKGAAPRLLVTRREWAGRLQTWYLAHLSLGTLAGLWILLHSGFRFGNVVATLAFLCLLGVVLTGYLGLYLYRSVPPRLTIIEERVEQTPEELRDELTQVMEEIVSLVQNKSETFRRVYDQETSIPGISMQPTLGWLTAPATIDRDTTRPDRLRLVVKEIPPTEQEEFRKVIRLIFRKEKIEVSLYPQLRYDYLLKIWLSAHIPLSAGMWAFSAVHVLSVLYF